MYEKIENEILSYLPSNLDYIKNVDMYLWKDVQEIRIRAGRPISLKFNNYDVFIGRVINAEEIIQILSNFSNNSIYSVQSEINQGFLTIRGGHRIGISGTCVFENNEIKSMKNISSLNIRVAREVKGASKNIIEYILNENDFENTLIMSPPRMW